MTWAVGSTFFFTGDDGRAPIVIPMTIRAPDEQARWSLDKGPVERTGAGGWAKTWRPGRVHCGEGPPPMHMAAAARFKAVSSVETLLVGLLRKLTPQFQ